MKTSIYGCSIMALAIGLAAPAFAQDVAAAAANPAPAVADDRGIADIVVTAQKRSEDGQKAALAVTVLNAEALATAHVVGAADLQRVIPNLTAQSGGGAGDPGGATTLFTIRGLGASASGPQGSTGVAVHFDGVFRQDGVSNSEFFDLERIEVDPGPQGTLYGRSAAAGAINVIPAKPNLKKNEAAASLGYGNYNALISEGMANLAFGDGKYGLRVGFQSQDHDGYYSNGYDDLHSISARAQFLAEPTDRLSVRLLGSFVHIFGTGTGNVYDGGPSLPNLVALVPRAGNPDLRQASVSELCLMRGLLATCRQTIDVKKYSALVDLSYDFGGAVLTLLPAYNEADRRSINSNAPLPLSTYDQTPYNNRQFNFEGRLSSPAGNRFKWVVGGNYYDNKVTNFINQFINVIVPVIPLPTPPFPPGTRVRGVASSNAFQNQRSEQESRAIFGQATYPVTETIRVTVGGRYNWDKSTGNQILGNLTNVIYVNSGFAPLVGQPLQNLLPAPIITAPQLGSQSFKAFTYRVAVDADIGPRSLVYASIGSGYKPGGLNDGGPRSSTPTTDPNYALAPDQFFGPEKVTHFEIGSKNRFASNTVQLNVAAYYDDYKNYQNGQTQIVNPLQFGSIGFVVTNAGKARLFGAEVDFKWQPTANDAIGVAVNYLDAKFTSYTAPAYLGPNGPSPAAVFNDFALPNAPKVSGNVSYQHTFDLNGSGKLVGSVFSHLTDGYYVYFAQADGTYQSSYTSTTLDLTWTSASRRYSVSAFVTNLEDRTVKVFGGTTAGYTEVGLAAPRLYGGKVAVRL